jgi:uncharacterized RDD family membrane protein YckC
MAARNQRATSRSRQKRPPPLASVTSRVLAHIYDSLILGFGFMVVMTIALNVGQPDDPIHSGLFRVGYGIMTLVLVVYEVAFIARTGATPGKRIADVRIVRLDGEPLGCAPPLSATSPRGALPRAFSRAGCPWCRRGWRC